MDYYGAKDGTLDWGYLIVKPLKDMLADLAGFIPNILGALLILFAGWMIAHLCRLLVGKFLKSIGFNSIAEKIGIPEVTGKNNEKIAPDQLMSLLAFWGVLLASFIMMLTRLGLNDLSFHIDKLFSYVITILIAVIIAVVGVALSMVVHRIIRSTAKSTGTSKPELSANIARWIILAFTGIVCLSQIGFHIDMLLIPIGIILATLCITFVLAFGLGGRMWAERMLDKIGK